MDFLLHALNGYKDHIRILLTIPLKLALADVVKHVKGATSHAIADVYWQNGYFAKTLHRNIVDTTIKYIHNQWLRHETKDLIAEMETKGWTG